MKEKEIKLSINSRGERFTKDKKVDDLVFSNLLLKSYYDEEKGERKAMKNFTMIQFANEIKGNRKTLKSKFKTLEEKGLIEEKDKYYIIKDIEGTFVQIPKDTLEYLVKTTTNNVIKVYCYLLGLANFNQSQGNTQTYFTKANILENLGYSYQNKNVKMLDDVLDILIKLNLIRFKVEGKGKEQRHILTFVATRIKREAIEEVKEEEQIQTMIVDCIEEETQEVREGNILEQKQTKIVSFDDFKF